MDNTPGDKLGVWRDMRLADALVFLSLTAAYKGNGNIITPRVYLNEHICMLYSLLSCKYDVSKCVGNIQLGKWTAHALNYHIGTLQLS